MQMSCRIEAMNYVVKPKTHRGLGVACMGCSLDLFKALNGT